MPPNIRLVARAFHRVAPSLSSTSSSSLSPSSPRTLSTSLPNHKWTGRQPEENPTRETDSHNVQHDAVKEGKDERARGAEGASGKDGERGSGSRGASEKDGGSAERMKEEFPEAPDTIGMQDERGGKS